VTATEARIFIEPHTKSTVIETVKRGDVLTLFNPSSEAKSWYYISYYSEEKWATLTGFVEASKVEVMGGVQPKAPEKRPAVKPERKASRPSPPKSAAAKPVEKKAAAPPSKKTAAGESEAEPEGKSGPVRYTGEVKITGEKPAIRAAAGESARILQVAQFAEVLELNGKQGDWYRVVYPRSDGIVLVGFVHQDQVEVLSISPLEAVAVGQVTRQEKSRTSVSPDRRDEKPEKEKTEGSEPDRGRPVESEPDPDRVTVLGPSPVGGRLFGLGLNGGYARPSESVYGGNSAFGLSFAYYLSTHFALEIGAYRTSSQVQESAEGLSTGKFTTLPLSVSLLGRYPLGDRMVPYGTAGAVFHFNSFKVCSKCRELWDTLGFDIQERVDNALGFQVGAGVDYMLSRRIGLNVDLRYQFLSTGGTWAMSDLLSGLESSGNLKDLNLNTLVFRVGAKIFLRFL
jgi:outer membrane protein W